MPTDLKGIKVLVVDDDPLIIEMLQLALCVYGGDVKTAMSVSEALKIFDSWQPDVLVSDLSMPGGNGLGLITEIRNMPDERRNIPAIALSGLYELNRTRAINLGFSLFVKKPVDPEELANFILQLAK